jgi:hypothetical protein
VIGARCAGAPTAMRLARRGHRVLLVDRATFPSDTMSTYLIRPDGLAALRRGGLLDDLIATGVPPCPTLRFDFGLVVVEGTSPAVDGISGHSAPRLWARVPVHRKAALAAAHELDELAGPLLSPRPLAARGVAQVRLLLVDGSSPLYFSRAEVDLRAAVARALEDLNPSLGW